MKLLLIILISYLVFISFFMYKFSISEIMRKEKKTYNESKEILKSLLKDVLKGEK